MLKSIARLGAGAMLILAAACAGDDDDVQSSTERLRPSPAPLCTTSDDCLYGYCSTEDGECRRGSACPPGSSGCGVVCYGSCIAAAPPN